MRFRCAPPDTRTQPTWRRPQADRDAISSAVAMKYSSHVGRSASDTSPATRSTSVVGGVSDDLEVLFALCWRFVRRSPIVRFQVSGYRFQVTGFRQPGARSLN